MDEIRTSRGEESGARDRAAVPALAGNTPPAAALEELDKAAAAFEAAERARNTARSYASDWSSWQAFCEEHGFEPLPASPEHLRLYFAHLAQGGARRRPLSAKTIQRHLWAIARAHRVHELPFDPNDAVFMKTLEGVRRAKGTRPKKQAKPLLAAGIVKICGLMTLRAQDVRDKALLLLGYAGAFRRSELAGLKVGDLQFQPEGMLVWLDRAKNDQEGEGRCKPIFRGDSKETCPVLAVQAWMRFAGIAAETTYAVFRSIDQWGNISKGALADKTVDRIVKTRCRQAGLPDGEEDKKTRARLVYSAHSLRAGHITEARDRGADVASIRIVSLHERDEQVESYDRALDLFRRPNSSKMVGL